MLETGSVDDWLVIGGAWVGERLVLAAWRRGTRAKAKLGVRTHVDSKQPVSTDSWIGEKREIQIRLTGKAQQYNLCSHNIMYVAS